MASRESSVHKCEIPRVSVCPALSSIAALMVFTSGFTRFAPASKSSVPGTSPLAPTAWNWGTKRPAGEESTEVKRYSKVFPFGKCQQPFAPSRHSWHQHPIWMGCQTEEKGESWWNMKHDETIHLSGDTLLQLPMSFYAYLAPSVYPIQDVHCWTSTDRFTPSRWLGRHCTCAYHPPSSPGSSTKHQTETTLRDFANLSFH